MFKRNPRTYAARGPNGGPDVQLHGVKFPFRLNFYTALPSDDQFTLDDLEQIGLDRLRVLKAVEDANLRGKDDQQLAQLVQPVLKSCLPMDRPDQAAKRSQQLAYQQQRRRDFLSHFILRLAFCKTEDQRNWLLRQETSLFKLRWLQEDREDRERFLAQSGIDQTKFGTILAKNELETYRSELNTLLLSLPVDKQLPKGQEPVMQTTFYRVPFERVPELVSQRQSLVKKGEAIFAENWRVHVILGVFRDKLREALEVFARMLPTLGEEDRLIPILDSIGSQYLGRADSFVSRFAGDGTLIQFTSHDVESLSPHFPPCMRNLHSQLTHGGHLKHQGRMQYGLFLKAVGLPLDESLKFWRKSFRTLTDDEFNRRYAYNIRHNYGMEGKRTNYSPYSCIKIIMGNHPGPGDHHGCPFRHFDPHSLEKLLAAGYGVEGDSANEVLALSRNGHYQLACTRLYEVSRPIVTKRLAKASHFGSAEGNVKEEENAESITHPNQFFEMSFVGVHGMPEGQSEESGMAHRPKRMYGGYGGGRGGSSARSGQSTAAQGSTDLDQNGREDYGNGGFDDSELMDVDW